ncbi:BA14K family protein [Hyphomicrobium sp.]|uniref:BA14K family protein n=1 Tax=Hyphomicrobium sp. TaxID=82 RepID=UPI002FE14D1B
MRSTRVLAFAALAALPLMASAASAAPVTPNTGAALSKAGTDGLVVDVRRSGGGGGHGIRSGGGGGRHIHGGGGPRFGGGGKPHRPGGGHWHGGGHHGHGHFRPIRPRWYGVPYFYYGPSYYYDDFYEDDYDDYDVAPSGDAIARCEARYRSFDRRTGTFLGYDGKRRLCPYLR